MKKIAIIGAGIGGLTAGNLLAKKGYQVTIFESHSTPGGYIACFWCKGFYFESGTLSFESANMIFNAMKEIGVFDKIEFVEQKSRWVSADFDRVPETFDDFKKIFFSTYPNEKQRLNKYFKEVDIMVRAFQPFMTEKKRILDTISSGFNIFRIYRKYGNLRIGDFTDRF